MHHPSTKGFLPTVQDVLAGAEGEPPADAMFVFIGAMSGSDVVRDLVEVEEHRLVLTGQDLIRDGHRPRG